MLLSSLQISTLLFIFSNARNRFITIREFIMINSPRVSILPQSFYKPVNVCPLFCSNFLPFLHLFSHSLAIQSFHHPFLLFPFPFVFFHPSGSSFCGLSTCYDANLNWSKRQPQGMYNAQRWCQLLLFIFHSVSLYSPVVTPSLIHPNFLFPFYLPVFCVLTAFPPPLPIRSAEWFIALQQAGRCGEEKGRRGRWKEEGLRRNGAVWRLKYMKEWYKIHLVHPWGTLCTQKQREGRGT